MINPKLDDTLISHKNNKMGGPKILALCNPSLNRQLNRKFTQSNKILATNETDLDHIIRRNWKNSRTPTHYHRDKRLRAPSAPSASSLSLLLLAVKFRRNRRGFKRFLDGSRSGARAQERRRSIEWSCHNLRHRQSRSKND